MSSINLLCHKIYVVIKTRATDEVALFFKLLSVYLILSISVPQLTYGQPLDFRGLWVIRNSITSKEKIEKMIEISSTYGFNNIIVQVRGRGDAYYESEFVPRAEELSDGDFDPLRLIISLARARGIRVHAWVNVYYLWSSSSPPRNRGHLYYTHPEWSATTSDGIADVKKSREYFRRNGIEGMYISPTHPEVNLYLLDVIDEIIRNYQVDGIHLDYVRYPDKNYGYNPEGRKIFIKKYGMDPISLVNESSSRSFFGNFFYNRSLKQWNYFRKHAITEFVKNVRKFVKGYNPEILLTAAVKPDMEEAENRYYQDWVLWIKKGYLDYVLPMNYTVNTENYAFQIKKILKSVPKEKLIMGVATFNQNRYEVLSKIYKAKAYGIKNFSFFSYSEIRNSPEYLKLISQALDR